MNEGFSLPKFIIQEILCLFTHQEIPNLALTCKQFSNIIRSDNFWKRMLESKISTEDIIKLDDKSWKENYKEFFIEKWDNECSDKSLRIVKNTLKHKIGSDGLVTAFSKKFFKTGEGNYMFVFQAKTDFYALIGAGCSKENSPTNTWLHNGKNVLIFLIDNFFFLKKRFIRLWNVKLHLLSFFFNNPTIFLCVRFGSSICEIGDFQRVKILITKVKLFFLKF